MRVGEEYKHFAMDLEFLLRRTPKWRQIAQGVLFQEGDIVEHGEAAEAEVGGRGRRRRTGRRDGRGLARDREPAMSNHLLRAHAPITDAGLGADRRRGARPAHPRARRPAAGRLRWAPGLGALGHEPRARRGRRAEPAGRGRRPPPARPAARRGAGALHRVARRAGRRRPRRRRRRLRRARRGRPAHGRRRELGRVPRLVGRRDRRRRAPLAARLRSRAATTSTGTRASSRARSRRCCATASAGRTGSRSAARSTRG